MPSLRTVGSQGKAFPLLKRITSIGSAPENDVRLEGALAPTHALIHFDGSDFLLKSAERGLEFEVNGKARKSQRLNHGDRLRIGDVELEFRILDEAARDVEALATTELTAYRKLQEFSERLLGRYELADLLDALIDSVIELTQADKAFLILVEGQEL